jgi:aminoglycoside/choline kinase family phosphotransferase
MEKINKWLEEIDCEGSLELLPTDRGLKKFYRLKSSMHFGIVMDSSLEKESLEPFIQLNHALFEAGVHVPKIFTYNRNEGFAFMEDLGNTHLCDVVENDFELFYDKAIDSIVKMQNTEIEALESYGEEQFISEMHAMQEFYLEKTLQTTLSSTEQKELNQTIEAIQNVVISQPQDIFVHTAFHALNLMFNCSDSVVVMDYQDAKFGAITYDLASLLRDVHVHLEENDIKRLALSFKEKKGLDIDDETFMKWFDFTGMQRQVKLLGEYAKKNDVEKSKRIVKSLIGIASKYTETSILAKILA